MRNITLLIKPASGSCNLRCRYCFYEDETERRCVKNHGIMSENTVAALLHNLFSCADEGADIRLCFQGGEPTLAGLSFFENFVSSVNALNTRHACVTYSIQTNATLLTPAWCAFLASHHFLTGVSIDGTPEIHDRYRLDAQGNVTYRNVRRNLLMLERSGVETNLLCVVTNDLAQAPEEVYRALKALHVRHFQMIPCLDPMDGSVMPWSLSNDCYLSFLTTLFDLWFRDWQRKNYYSIRMFEDLVFMDMGEMPSACAACGQCGASLVIEADGSVYPCDFYCTDAFMLGSVHNASLADLFRSSAMQSFRRKNGLVLSQCRTCAYEALCHGGCQRDWLLHSGEPRNRYCEVLQRFLEKAYPRIHEIVLAERAAREN